MWLGEWTQSGLNWTLYRALLLGEWKGGRLLQRGCLSACGAFVIVAGKRCDGERLSTERTFYGLVFEQPLQLLNYGDGGETTQSPQPYGVRSGV